MINSSRLLIKPWTIEDTDLFYKLTHDLGFNLHLITNYKQQSLESSNEWIQNAIKVNKETGNLGKYAVWEKSSDSLIGLGGLTPWTFENEYMIDITYRLAQSFWGKGYGLELAQTLVDYGFNTLGLREITATITPDNIPSKKIAEKLGMKFDRRIILLGVQTDLYRLNS